MSFIAYLDLLGVREMAEFDFNRYYESMIELQSVALLVLSGESTPDDISIKYFSDCLFVESNEIRSIVLYMDKLRKLMFAKKIFLKASITDGKLLSNVNEEDIDNEISDLKGRYSNYHLPALDSAASVIKGVNVLKQSLGRRAEGIGFLSPDICRAVGMEHSFKGVGVSVDFKLEPEKQIPELIVESFCYVEGSIIPYIDLKISKDKLKKTMVDILFETVSVANIGSSYVGSKYISLLATYVNSEDYDLDLNEIGNTYSTGSPLINAFITLRSSSPKLFSQLKGLSYIYLLIINNFYGVERYDEAAKLVAKFSKMGSIISRFEGKFDSIPDCIISKRHRVRLKSDYYNSQLPKSAKAS